MGGKQTQVAVYGTLKSGQSNHRLLAGQTLVCRCELPTITLYDLGPYPAAKLSNSDGVGVEVYRVSEEAFARLDDLEGYDAEAPASGLYDRVQLQTPFGLAWVYIYNHDVSGCPEIRSGLWLPAG